jgi:hypothetical protein
MRAGRLNNNFERVWGMGWGDDLMLLDKLALVQIYSPRRQIPYIILVHIRTRCVLTFRRPSNIVPSMSEWR